MFFDDVPEVFTPETRPASTYGVTADVTGLSESRRAPLWNIRSLN